MQEDHFLAEIIDPESGAPLPDGERGELVLTTLTEPLAVRLSVGKPSGEMLSHAN